MHRLPALLTTSVAPVADESGEALCDVRVSIAVVIKVERRGQAEEAAVQACDSNSDQGMK